ncbi:ScaI family restriction endonuclease [Desulfovibrio sp. SGI.082]|jgi:hypothetical protein|uniref:ScaI family restriction endonuclease n=1 Tax=Desulfovibrio TaxID=872 RepID=UPI00195EE4AF|nr:ScaI family restriction endonuclease [Desulfovibrio piger]MBM6895703.1 ScaI family restriction endonuclease [Desulfovibrio piger]
MNLSPYKNIKNDEWISITERLIREFPIELGTIAECVDVAWRRVWQTRIGTDNVIFQLNEINPPAPVIGYLFEKLFAKELSILFPEIWRGGSGNEKDVVNIHDEKFSFEIKTSGQLGTKIYGNRSYGQKVEHTELEKKDKSGYYLTVNFYKDHINLIRFGWIDANDWRSQNAASGQMASLHKDVYKYKLKKIICPYILKADIEIIDNIGTKTAQKFYNLNVYTVGDLLKANNLPKKLEKLKNTASAYYGALLQIE